MKKILGFVIVVVLVLLDQWTKILAIGNLMGKKDFVIIKDVLRFHYLENTGVAWGMFSNGTLFFSIITSIMTVALIYVFLKTPTAKRMLPINIVLILLMSGAIGNLIDRVFRQYVVDFIYVEIINFPVFNVADCYVTVAGIAMVVLVFFFYKEEDFAFLKINSSKDKNKGQD